ncbi:hypothetical protein C8F01DRAFT_671930 [Mycena amicta]|nr:hypothetical protein C8F01DRAFT_671930 [Mycena amicta]
MPVAPRIRGIPTPTKKPEYWNLLDPARIPPAHSLEDAFPDWPYRDQVPAALRAINTLLRNRPEPAVGFVRAKVDSAEYALWHRLLPWMLFFQRYHALGFLSPALCRAIPELNICLPFLHFTMEVFQPIDGDLTELYKTTPGLARLLFHTWRLIVEDGGKTDELGYRALTVLLPREFTAEMFASSVEGAGGTLGHVAALIARHIEVFGPRISRRVPGPERLMPIGIHLGVFRTVLLTTNALSKFCIGASDSSSSSTTEDHFGPFIRTLAPALSLPALTKCLKQLGRIPVGEDVGTNNSPWDGALYETLSLLSASLMIDRHGISSALRHGLVPALARCCQRELSGRTARKVAFFVANILGPATMLRSLGKYIKSDREEVVELVAEATRYR